MSKELGKIENVYYGLGGYQDAMLGISFQLSFGSCGTGDFWGYWDLERTEHCKWTEEDRLKFHGENTMRIGQLLKDAKVYKVEDLVGIPIEVTSEGMNMKSWRVLTEVL